MRPYRCSARDGGAYADAMSNTPEMPPVPPAPSDRYPVNFDVEYPDRPFNRVTTFFRGILAIPVLILLEMFVNSISSNSGDAKSFIAIGGFIFLPTLLLLLFRHRYPRWWFDFNVNLLAFAYRVAIYLYLLRDEYPSTEDRQALLLEIPYPDAKQDLSRGMPLVKWLLAFPHYLILSVLALGVAIARSSPGSRSSSRVAIRVDCSSSLSASCAGQHASRVTQCC